MGDAVLCTPTLKSLRTHFSSAKITFYANQIAKDTLSPTNLADQWVIQKKQNPFVEAAELKKINFSHAVLFKNSFASALTIFLARIPQRIGYTRQGRGLFLTDKIKPEKINTRSFKPISMVDYYNRLAMHLGATQTSTKLQLSIDPKSAESLKAKLTVENNRPIFIIVPGGTFGPSKQWPAERFAETADALIEKHNAQVFISVSPAERKIAQQICDSSSHPLINLGEKNLTLGELKALFAKAALVISNDTGPRHIAIALNKKIVTLFGPNNPQWTETGYENEIKIIANVPCSPCDKPVCKQPQHLCMESITTDMVLQAAEKLISN